jgi:hypothetical protein
MKKEQLKDGYYFPGFYPLNGVESFPGNSQGKVIRLKRHQKKRYAATVAQSITDTTISGQNTSMICLAARGRYIFRLISGGCFVNIARW